MTILQQSAPRGLRVRVSALQLLLGAQPEQAPELAKLAGPVFHIDDSDPPLLLFHGDQDQQMPIEQSYEFAAKYREQGLSALFEAVPGAVHGGPEFSDERRLRFVTVFLNQSLRPR